MRARVAAFCKSCNYSRSFEFPNRLGYEHRAFPSASERYAKTREKERLQIRTGWTPPTPTPTAFKILARHPTVIR